MDTQMEEWLRDPQKWLLKNIPHDHPLVQIADHMAVEHKWNEGQWLACLASLSLGIMDSVLKSTIVATEDDLRTALNKRHNHTRKDAH